MGTLLGVWSVLIHDRIHESWSWLKATTVEAP